MRYSPVLAWPPTVHFHLIEDNIMKRVQVYWNLHLGRYSVRQSGRVIDHVDSIILRDVRFNVAPAGRDKVRATGVKNVHATVTGYIVDNPDRGGGFLYTSDVFFSRGWQGIDYDHVTYNPFKWDNFMCRIMRPNINSFAPVSTAEYVMLLPNREIRAWGVK